MLNFFLRNEVFVIDYLSFIDQFLILLVNQHLSLAFDLLRKKFLISSLSFELAFQWFVTEILQPTQKELNDSIDELRSYRNRLRSEIINISQKLRVSQVKIEATLKESSQLQELDDAIEKLTKQRDFNASSK